MWLIIQRQPKPDARVWPGRRGLAAVDAVVFPALWIWAITQAPFATGAVGQAVAVVAVLLAVRRLGRAIGHNERYQFTTWRWGRLLVGLLLVAAAWTLIARWVITN